MGPLFSDVPTQTHVLEHDIDVGSSSPIKQHAYRVNLDKRARLQQQVDYMLENGIEEPSCSVGSVQVNIFKVTTIFFLNK